MPHILVVFLLNKMSSCSHREWISFLYNWASTNKKCGHWRKTIDHKQFLSKFPTFLYRNVFSEIYRLSILKTIYFLGLSACLSVRLHLSPSFYLYLSLIYGQFVHVSIGLEWDRIIFFWKCCTVLHKNDILISSTWQVRRHR